MLSKLAKRAVKAAILPLFDAVNLYDAPINRLRASASHWTIVMYHRVIDDPALDPFGLGMCVTRAHFAQQIEYFVRNFNLMPMKEAVDRLVHGQPLPQGTLSVTFDDGYADNLTVALPIMERYGVSFALFVPTGGVVAGESLLWDRVICAVASTARRSINAADAGLPRDLGALSLSGWQRAHTAEVVLDALWTLPFERLIVAVAKLEQALQPSRDAASFAPRLSPEMIREMHRRGVEIGAHSVWHPNLPLGSADDVRREMLESKRYLEEVCVVSVDGFAYPGGHVNEQTVAAAVAAGFKYAVAASRGINGVPYTPHLLSRIGMPDAPVINVKRSLARLAKRAPRLF